MVRLDLFLKITRLSPRRTLAQQLCDAGFALLNGRRAKPAHIVKIGDEISIRRRDHEIGVRVLEVPGTRNVSRRDSSRLIEVIDERIIEGANQ
jgi:ribosomal 50S subunit-recycling heat shock protein